MGFRSAPGLSSPIASGYVLIVPACIWVSVLCASRRPIAALNLRVRGAFPRYWFKTVEKYTGRRFEHAKSPSAQLLPEDVVGRGRSSAQGLCKSGARLSDVDAALCEPRNWIDCGVAVWVNLEVQVGTGGETKVAHAGDLLACGDLLANGNVEGFHVAVNGNGTILVFDADPITIAGSWAGVDDGAIHDSQDWGAVGVCDV